MPTYGYECLSCDNEFEVFQSIKDNALTTCNSCGGALRKRIYPVGIAFKGSGFYVNDYAPKSEGSTKKGEAASETPKTETSGEAKPEAKTETVKAEPKAETKIESKTETKTPTAVAP